MQKMLLLIDTDDGLEREITKNLRQEMISEEFFVKRISPDVTFEPPDLIAKCVLDVQEVISSEPVIACFVDIVIFERGIVDKIGVDIAVELRRQIPRLPVFCTTSKLKGKEEIDHFSEATTLGLDGVFTKSFLGGDTFSTRRLRTILASANKKREALGSVGDLHEVKSPQLVMDNFNASSLDPRIAIQINALGSGHFWTLLGMLLPSAQGVLHYMFPGRSGACVLRVTAKIREESGGLTRPKAWVVKICTDSALIAKEVDGYRSVVMCPVGRTHIPRLLNNSSKSSGALHGIVYEFEEFTETLLKDMCKCNDKDHCDTLAKQICEVLSNLYGDPELQIVPIWNEYKLDENTRGSILAFLDECQNSLSEWIEPAMVKRVAAFICSLDNCLGRLTQEVDIRDLHGDLNCGNLLMSSDNCVRFIDFASRKRGGIAGDIAKLERDVVFRICDAGSARYHEWTRSAEWRHFSRILSIKDFFGFSYDANEADPNILTLIHFVREIRAGLSKMARKLTSQQYLCSLLRYSLLAILHPELSTAKKVFAVEYVDAIRAALASAVDQDKCKDV